MGEPPVWVLRQEELTHRIAGMEKAIAIDRAAGGAHFKTDA